MFCCTAVFMNLHKLTITLTLNPIMSLATVLMQMKVNSKCSDRQTGCFLLYININITNQAFIASTKHITNQSIIEPTKHITNQSFIAPTKHITNQSFIASTKHITNQSVIASTKHITNQSFT